MLVAVMVLWEYRESCLVCYYWTGRCSCVCGDDHAIVVYAPYDGCTCACGFW